MKPLYVNVYKVPHQDELVYVKGMKDRRAAEYDASQSSWKLLYRIRVTELHEIVSENGRSYRLRKAWRISTPGLDSGSIMYGPDRSKVRYSAWLRLGDCFPDLKLIDVRVRRAAYADVKLPLKNPLADKLSADAKHCLLHAFGANSGDVTKAGHRDYFYTRRNDPPLVECENLGLMEPMKGDQWGEGMTYFVLTTLGKSVALSLTPEY